MAQTATHKTWFGHPAGLSTLFFTELWERFSYYGMRALLVLYMVASVDKGGLGFDIKTATGIYGLYTALVYAATVPGGWVADKLLGPYLTVLVGGIVLMFGHFTLAFEGPAFFYSGLGLIIIGTGLLKPNISTMVGSLYEVDDARRDGGFSIFYMGINLGAMLAPLVCGTLGQKVGWHYGFAMAGVGMFFGVIQYIVGRRRLEPALEKLKAEKAAHTTAGGKATPLSQIEKKRLIVLGTLFVFSILFWAAFEQAGSSLNLFADQKTELSAFGHMFPSSWFQSLNSVFILLLAPVFAWLWVRLGRREPSSPTKFALGLLFVGLGFLVLVPGAMLAEAIRVSPMWLVAVYFLHTIGELCLSPVGLSICTKLAPSRYVGSVMGGWFLSSALGSYLGGWIAGFFETLPLPQLFGSVFLTTTSAAVLLALLIRPINKLLVVPTPEGAAGTAQPARVTSGH